MINAVFSRSNAFLYDLQGDLLDCKEMLRHFADFPKAVTWLRRLEDGGHLHLFFMASTSNSS